METLEKRRIAALEVARSAGTIINSAQEGIAFELKADGSEVTEADRRAEQVIRQQIQAHYPNEPILGEEFGGDDELRDGYLWIVDPIDGTTPYAIGSPIFGTLIGLLYDGKPVVGVIHFPALNESLSAAVGHGCWFHGRGEAPAQRVRSSQVTSVSNAFISTAGLHGSEVSSTPSYRLSSLMNQARRLRVLGDCYQHALVCRGKIDVAIDAIMKPWDSAALIPCLVEAGAYVSDIRGNQDDVTFSGSLLSASTRALSVATVDAMTP